MSKKNQVTHNIEFYGLQLEVAGCFYAGSFATRELPADPQEFEIDAVYLNDADITELLQDSYNSAIEVRHKVTKIEELEKAILEKHYT